MEEWISKYPCYSNKIIVNNREMIRTLEAIPRETTFPFNNSPF